MKLFSPSKNHSPDPADTAGGAGGGTGDGSPGTPPPAANAEPPPAAAAVLANPGAKPEDAAEMVRLRQELEEERRAKRARETRVSELEDENRRLKTPPAENPAKKGSGWTYFDPE